MPPKERVAEIGAEVVAAIEKIDQEAAEKKKRHIGTLKDAIKVARLEVKAAEDKVASLESLLGILTGKPVEATSEKSGTRMKAEQRDEYVAALGKTIGSGRMKKADIIGKIGLPENQWNTIRKAAGKKLKMHGTKINAEYTWEG